MEQRESGGIGFKAGQWPLDPEKPTLVFIHGSGLWSGMWVNQIDAFPDLANTVALDLPGHGRSDGAGMERIEDYTGVVAEFIQRISAPAPIPSGLSLGGAIAQQLLLDYPDRFSAGILLSTGGRLKVLPEIMEIVINDFPSYLTMFGQMGLSEKSDPEIIRPLLEKLEKVDPRTILGDFKACNRFDVMKRLPSIRARVLATAALDDKLTPPKYGEFLANHIPNARLVHLSDAGHLAPFEKPDAVNGAIENFLDG
ncbi:MAG: alpha/beta hydrolase [Desulfobacterales bacterium]|nr:alpha/beta hydrolase [Desulfobacterales bacterium]